jgi:hypothetical protein
MAVHHSLANIIAAEMMVSNKAMIGMSSRPDPD